LLENTFDRKRISTNLKPNSKPKPNSNLISNPNPEGQ